MSDPVEPVVSPLPADLEGFLRPERRRPDPTRELQGEIFARLQRTLGLPGGPPDDGGPGPSAPPAGHGGTTAPAAAAKAAAAGSGLKLVMASHPLIATVATFLAGAGVGAGIHEAMNRSNGHEATTAATLSIAAPSPPAADNSAPGATASVTRPAIEPAPATTPRKPRGDGRERDRDLTAERTLIEQARTALSRDKAEIALTALERHARTFPVGALEEEREGLLVQTLVELRRYDQARTLAARFHRRFPRSIFAAVIDEAIRSIP